MLGNQPNIPKCISGMLLAIGYWLVLCEGSTVDMCHAVLVSQEGQVLLYIIILFANSV